MNRLDIRLRWFDRGADAFRRACPTIFTEVLPPDTPAIYVCPCCVTEQGFKGLLREALLNRQLTEEHVPPEAVGGRPLILTCAPCNSNAGSRLDAHADKAFRVEDDPPGTFRDQSVRVGLLEHEITMTMTASSSGGIQLFGEPRRSNPRAHTAFFQELEELTRAGSTNWSFKLRFREPFNRGRAAVSWLRAAYLVVFAKFGYRVILDKAFQVVRQKIANPEVSRPSLFSIRVPGPKNLRSLVILHEPQELAGGIGVRMGQHIVLLPGPGDVAFYDRIAGQEGKPAALSGLELEWPKGPECLYDFQPS
jgi:hypothetical protein